MSFGNGSLSLKVEGALAGSSGGSEWYDFWRRSILYARLGSMYKCGSGRNCLM